MQGNSARQPPYIAHYGIRGQKWGVRNYQNEDGSLTPAGKQRYNTGTKGVFRFGRKKKRDWKAKDASELSDEELRKRNNRLQAEQIYKNSMTPQWKKDAKQNAKNWRNEILKAVLVTAVATVAAEAVKKKVYSQAVDKISSVANRKIATIKATNMLKQAVNKTNMFDRKGPEIIGKHVGNLITKRR